MINWKIAKKCWMKAFRSNPQILNTPEKIEEAENFVKKYSSKIRWSQTICELGVGDGKHLHYFLERYPDKKYCGVDFNPNVLELIKNNYLDVSENCNIESKSTDNYLKYLKCIDTIFTDNHLMYIPDDLIDRICSKISFITNKYILIRESYTRIEYTKNNLKKFLNCGFGRDYTNLFEDFELKSKDKEILIVNDEEIEFYTYLFKKIG